MKLGKGVNTDERTYLYIPTKNILLLATNDTFLNNSLVNRGKLDHMSHIIETIHIKYGSWHLLTNMVSKNTSHIISLNNQWLIWFYFTAISVRIIEVLYDWPKCVWLIHQWQNAQIDVTDRKSSMSLYWTCGFQFLDLVTENYRVNFALHKWINMLVWQNNLLKNQECSCPIRQSSPI